MDFYTLIFYFFAVLTLAAASVVVFGKNVVRSAFALLFAFIGVAGLYVLLYADFIALAQVLIYVGGILVLIVFGIMLTTSVIDVNIRENALNAFPGVILASAAAGTLIGAVTSTEWRKVINYVPPEKTIEDIGRELLTRFVLPFEVASVLLLVAIIGAAMIARREKRI